MTVRTVTSHVLDLHGAARVGDLVRFRLLDGMYTGAAHIPADVQTATIDASGNISIVLYAPANYDVIIANAMRFQFTLPDSAVTTTLEALHASGEASPTATNALQLLIDAHAAQADPHAVYLTQSEGDARYSLTAHTQAWSTLTGTPTTLAGYAITDAYTKVAADARYAPIAVPFASLTGKPTTLAGYGITDAYTQAQVTASLALKSNLAGGNTFTGSQVVSDGAVLGTEKALTLGSQGTPFTLHVASASFSGTRDDISYWAYNLVAGSTSSKVTAGEPQLKFALESDYNTGSTHLMEYNMDYTSIDALTNKRPMSWNVNRVSQVSSWVLSAGAISFSSENNAHEYVKLTSASGINCLKFDAGTSQSTNNLTEWRSFSTTVMAAITSDGTLSTNTIAAPGGVLTMTAGLDVSGAIGVGTINSGSSSQLLILSSATNVTGLVVKGAAGQVAELLALRASPNTTVFSVDASGNIIGTQNLYIRNQTGRINFGTSDDIYITRSSAGSLSIPGSLQITSAASQGIGLNISIANVGDIGAMIKAKAGQTADILQIWNSSNAKQIFITKDFNLGIGPAAAFGGGIGVIGLLNAGTVPASTPAGGGVLFSEAGALKWKGSSGTVSVIAPA